MTDEEEAEALSLPRDVAELHALIANKSREAASIVCGNESAVREYEEREEQLNELRRELERHRGTRDSVQAEVDALKATWLPRLEHWVGKISDAFQECAASVGAGGCCELVVPDDPNAFGAYELHLKVKFRDGAPLQRLTAHLQSGGERSVSTMGYLLALQGMTKCPFRVVDEINQGMDAKNERRVFQNMVAACSRPGTPQCFLLTPKLLPQLDYGDCVSVLFVYNGPFLKDVTDAAAKAGRSLLFGSTSYVPDTRAQDAIMDDEAEEIE